MDISSLHLDMGGLIASLIWGGIGLGFLAYGRKQHSVRGLIGGAGLIGISYFLADSAFWMSVAGVGIVIGIYYWSKRDE